MRRRRVRTALGAFALGAFATGCIALLDLTREQCTTDADCAGRGGAFTTMKCDVGTNLCVSAAFVERDTGTDAPTVPVEASLPEASTDAPTGCISNKACTTENAGEPHICEKATGKCIRVKSETCPAVINWSDSDDAILVAAFSFISSAPPLNFPVALSYQLALGEIQAVAGLPPAASGGRRPLTAVLCDGFPSNADKGVDHVIQDLHVPAAIGYFTDDDTTRLFQDKFVPNNVFFLNPGAVPPALKNATGTKGLIWHMLGPATGIGMAFVPALARAEAYVRASVLAPPGTEDLRVATVTSSSATDLATAENFASDLRWNNKTPLENGTSRYLALSVPSLETNPSADFSSQTSQLLAFKPHIVIANTSEELPGSMLGPLEQGWAASAGSQPRPFYILGGRSALGPVGGFISSPIAPETPEQARKRFLGVQYAAAADPAEYNYYVLRARSKFGPNAQGYESTENYYDAIYWLAYGTAAAGPVTTLSGPDIARGVRKMLTGSTVVKTGGPDVVGNSFTALALGAETSFLGTMGTSDFDPATGWRKSVGSLFCFNAADGGVLTVAYDTLRYNPSSKALDPGVRSFCFPSF